MTRSVEIPEEALTAAVTAYRSEGLRERVASTPHMRAALEAALPYLAPAVPQPVDREAPTREQIAEALRDHYPTTGMAVARGVTCECGYWNGEEAPGVDRPAGAQGRDGLNWHRAQVVLAMLASEQEQVESPE